MTAAQDDPAKGLEVRVAELEFELKAKTFEVEHCNDYIDRLEARALAAEADAKDLRERLETARIARVEHNRQHHEERMARMGAEADASKVREALTEAEASARRYARCYPEASDGRNTFTMLADHIATLTQRGA